MTDDELAVKIGEILFVEESSSLQLAEGQAILKALRENGLDVVETIERRHASNPQHKDDAE